MKKLVSLALVLAMLCCAFSVLAEDSTVYYLNSIIMGDSAYNPADLGMEITLTLNADGTGIYATNGDDDPVSFTWVSDGSTLTMTMNDEQTAFTVTESGLQASDEDVTMTFTTEAPVAVNLGNPVAADQTAFNGTWNCTYIGMDGTNLPTAALVESWETLFGTTDTTIVVADGTVTVCGGDPVAYTFADGKLTYSVEDNELSGETVELTDAGYLVYTMDSMGLSLYCEPVAQ